MASNLTETQRAFLQTYTPLAQDVAAATGLDPTVVLGQIAQETGWGAHVKGNNVFGISPGGAVAEYPTVQDAARAYVDLVRTRYGAAASARTPDAQAKAIAALGYNPSKDYGGLVAQNAATIRSAGPAATLNDDDLNRRLLSEPPADRTPTITVRPDMSDADLDRRLLGDAADLKPGDIDPITHQPVQFAGKATGPVAQSLGKPIQENRNPGPVTQATINLATDPEQRRRIAAAQVFPGMPEKAAESRVFYGDGGRLAAVDAQGNPFYVDPRGPDIDPARGRFDLGNPLAYVGSAAPGLAVTAAGVAGGAAAGPGSLVFGPGLAAGGAAAADLGRQYLARQFDPAATPPPINLLQTGGAALGAGGGQFGGALLGRMAAPNPLRLSPGEVSVMRTEPAMADTTNAYARARAQGVDLTPGQASNLPSLLQFEDAATTLPQTVDRATDFYRAQGNQLQGAGQNMLSSISPVVDKSDAALQFQHGAQDAITKIRQGANAAAKDAYARADATPMPKANSRQVDLFAKYGGGAVLPEDRFLPYDMLGTPDGARVYNAARVSAANDGVVLPTIDRVKSGQVSIPFQGWDYMKKVLQGEASEAGRAGNYYRATQLTDMANGIRDEVIRVNPAYGEALDAVAPGQRQAQLLRETTLGRVGEGNPDARARAIVAPIFERSNPRYVATARDAFEKAGRLDEWNAGVRSYIQDAFDRASMSQQGLNPAMLRRQVWGNVENREAIRAALTPQQYEGFDNFLRTVEDVSRTYPMNSLTATRQNARGALTSAAEGGGNVKALDTIATAFSPIRYTDFGNMVLGGLRQRMVQSNMQRIVGHLFDADGLQYLEAMAGYKPGTQRAIEATAQALGRAGNTLLSSPGADRANTQTANPLAAVQ